MSLEEKEIKFRKAHATEDDLCVNARKQIFLKVK